VLTAIFVSCHGQLAIVALVDLFFVAPASWSVKGAAASLADDARMPSLAPDVEPIQRRGDTTKLYGRPDENRSVYQTRARPRYRCHDQHIR
jgi:hypothetical protein